MPYTSTVPCGELARSVIPRQPWRLSCLCSCGGCACGPTAGCGACCTRSCRTSSAPSQDWRPCRCQPVANWHLCSAASWLTCSCLPCHSCYRGESSDLCQAHFHMCTATARSTQTSPVVDGNGEKPQIRVLMPTAGHAATMGGPPARCSHAARAVAIQARPRAPSCSSRASWGGRRILPHAPAAAGPPAPPGNSQRSCDRQQLPAGRLRRRQSAAAADQLAPGAVTD